MLSTKEVLLNPNTCDPTEGKKVNKYTVRESVVFLVEEWKRGAIAYHIVDQGSF